MLFRVDVLSGRFSFVSAAAAIICPKCGHTRTAAEVAPAWQCPACGIAYDKYRAYLGHAQKLVRPLRVDDAAPHYILDGSVWSLVAANLLALAIASYQGWSMVSLMLVYWTQSVIIGVANVFRMLALERFSTENLKLNEQPVDPTPETKWRLAGFFALHYGFFHFVYLIFLMGFSRGAPLFTPWIWACSAAFALNHLWSYRYNRDHDRQGTPNIGTLMMTPYLRIVPMHLTILCGDVLTHARAGLLLFGALKTAADVGMHVVEHGQIKKVRD
jgi:hypothetical protein